jgi:hypothetical protein
MQKDKVLGENDLILIFYNLFKNQILSQKTFQKFPKKFSRKILFLNT